MFKGALEARLCADATTNEVNGSACAQFRVATTTSRRDSSGSYISNFYNVTVWGKASASCAYLTKGARVLIYGELVQRPYKNKAGVDAVSMDITADNVRFLDARKSDDDIFN